MKARDSWSWDWNGVVLVLVLVITVPFEWHNIGMIKATTSEWESHVRVSQLENIQGTRQDRRHSSSQSIWCSGRWLLGSWLVYCDSWQSSNHVHYLVALFSFFFFTHSRRRRTLPPSIALVRSPWLRLAAQDCEEATRRGERVLVMSVCPSVKECLCRLRGSWLGLFSFVVPDMFTTFCSVPLILSFSASAPRKDSESVARHSPEL